MMVGFGGLEGERGSKTNIWARRDGNENERVGCDFAKWSIEGVCVCFIIFEYLNWMFANRCRHYWFGVVSGN